MKKPSGRVKKRKLTQLDYEFLLGTDLFKSAPKEAKNHLLTCMAPLVVKAGQRFIQQGEDGDSLYLVQSGSCVAIVEKQGEKTQVARRKAGELVGEMAICTGEPRTAHVEADTDMTLWRMSREEFDEICLSYPVVREFITRLVTNRITKVRVTAQKTIGKYVITDVVDEGGWGIVYKGHHESLNLPVAIKMLKHTMAMDNEFLTRFQNEANVIAQLKHQNIVRVYDVEQLYRTVFIVMEYLTGSSLSDRLSTLSRLPFPQALHYLVQVSQGLEYAHGEGIVHQDVKPGNIFIETSDRAKLIDFGLSCPQGTEVDLDFAGTPYYMAPEQIEGDSVDARTDIYSLGITAFEIATGQKPFPGRNIGAVMRAHCEQYVPNACSLNADLPSEFDAFVQKATRKNPSERYQSTRQVLEDLRAMAERFGTTRPPEIGDNRKMMSLLAVYGESDELEVTRLIEEFSQKLKDLHAELHVANYRAPHASKK